MSITQEPWCKYPAPKSIKTFICSYISAELSCHRKIKLTDPVTQTQTEDRLQILCDNNSDIFSKMQWTVVKPSYYKNP